MAYKLTPEEQDRFTTLRALLPSDMAEKIITDYIEAQENYEEARANYLHEDYEEGYADGISAIIRLLTKPIKEEN